MRLLIIIAVLFCSLHLPARADAYAPASQASLHMAAAHGDGLELGSTSPAAGKHVCPAAPDLVATVVPVLTADHGGPLFVGRGMPLPSLTIPPLLDPPLAV
ncbi:hypothetical protein [Sphingopyxis sp. R3-92]|uniref:hypothetical protein n=1 Tax=Sphingopyxis sp. R3-92 TaxID=3158553 RepID=UPI003EE74352